MPTNRTPEKIAKGLRPEQRAALLYVVAHPGSQHDEALDPNVCVVLRRVYGLMNRRVDEQEREYRLYPTDLGRAVAALLAQPEGESDAD